MSVISSLPTGYRHLALGDISSTNTVLLEHFDNGDAGKLWITAQQQLAGKGSRGRNWVSVRGNLYASLLLLTNLQPAQLANLAFVASVALFDTLAQYLPAARLSLKWPNDVLVNGDKISGILLENHPRPGRESGVIIGVGVNCNTHPADNIYKATNLAEQGVDVKPLELFHLLANNFEACLQIWNDAQNFDSIRNLWLERAQGLGEPILVKMPGRHLNGIFQDIDEAGLLILKTDDNRRHQISSADIFFSNHNEKSA